MDDQARHERWMVWKAARHDALLSPSVDKIAAELDAYLAYTEARLQALQHSGG